MLEDRNIPPIAILTTQIALSRMPSHLLASVIDHAHTGQEILPEVREELVQIKFLDPNGTLPSTTAEIVRATYDEKGDLRS